MTLDEAKAFVLSARPYLSYVSNTGDGMSSFLREVLIKASTVARQVGFWINLCLVVQIHVFLCGRGKASTVARQVSFWTTLCLVVQIHVYLWGTGKKGICF